LALEGEPPSTLASAPAYRYTLAMTTKARSRSSVTATKTKTKRHSFTAVLGGASGDRPVVELPFDVKSTFGSARAKVKVTVNGVIVRTTVAVYGGRSYVGFRKEIREAAGISVGDSIDVTVEADLEAREVLVPDDLARAFRKDKAARQVFEALAFTHRKEYARWVGEAKKPETAERRIRQTLEMLKTGTKHP
jgi:Bacteriocin-protection, YdeI or OmpD-Associated/Domain of unknown function (DUF1905)